MIGTGSRILRWVLLWLASGNIAYYAIGQFTTMLWPFVIGWFVAFVVLAALWRSGTKTVADSSLPKLPAWLGLVLAAFMYAFVAQWLPNLRLWAWLIFGVAAIAGTAAWLRDGRPLRSALVVFDSQPGTRVNDWFVWLVALGLAAVNAVTLRPQSDDTNYVNISTWIAERGSIPHRDTMYSDLHFPTSPLGSAWEVLWGATAHILHISAPTLLYVVVGPILTLLCVFALHQLFIAAQVRHLRLALFAAAVFLVLDGRNIYSWGIFELTRAWQGKAFFVGALLPLLLVFGTALLRTGQRREIIGLWVVVLASAGTTTTSVLLVPIVLVAICVPVAKRHGLGLGLAGLASGLSVIVVGLAYRNQPQETQSLSFIHRSLPLSITTEGQPGPEEYLRVLARPEWRAAFLGLILIWGWQAIASRSMRTLVAGLVGAWGIVYLPPVLSTLNELTRTLSISWRYWWLLPIPFLVGAAASAAWSSKFRIGAIVLVAAVFAGSALPVWQSGLGQLEPGHARLAQPGWKVFGGFYEVRKMVDQFANDGDLIAAPINAERSLTATTVRVHAVLPKDAWFKYISRNSPDAHYQERLAIRDFITYETDAQVPAADAAALGANLEVVGVDMVCLQLDRPQGIALVKSLGYDKREGQLKLGAGKGAWCGHN